MKHTAHFVLEEVARINPYTRQRANQKSEYYLYQMGFLAAFLAQRLNEDSLLRNQFKRHVEHIEKLQRTKQ